MPDAGASAAGASGSGTGGSGATVPRAPIVTGLDGSRLLSSLSAQEVIQLCEAYEAWYLAAFDLEIYARWYCTLEALDQSGTVDGGVIHVDVAACQAAASLCVAGPPPLPSFDCAQEAATSGRMAFETCHATVGSYEECAAATSRQSLSQFEAYTCESAEMLLNDSLRMSLEQGPDAPLPIERVPECSAYLALCPLTEP